MFVNEVLLIFQRTTSLGLKAKKGSGPSWPSLCVKFRGATIVSNHLQHRYTCWTTSKSRSSTEVLGPCQEQGVRQGHQAGEGEPWLCDWAPLSSALGVVFLACRERKLLGEVTRATIHSTAFFHDKSSASSFLIAKSFELARISRLLVATTMLPELSTHHICTDALQQSRTISPLNKKSPWKLHLDCGAVRDFEPSAGLTNSVSLDNTHLQQSSAHVLIS